MIFEFHGKPEYKRRPRFGRNGVVYDPSKKKSDEMKVDAIAQMALGRAEIDLESPISLKMSVYVPMPKSWPQKRKKEFYGNPATSKPDIDNYLKFYMDVLNGIGYEDDKNVTRVFTEKFWSYQGRVIINLEEAI